MGGVLEEKQKNKYLNAVKKNCFIILSMSEVTSCQTLEINGI